MSTPIITSVDRMAEDPTLLRRSADPGAVSSGTMLTRSVHVHITGSLANLAMQGVNAAIWKPVEGKQIHVFGAETDADAQIATNQLRTALIHEVQLLEHRWVAFSILFLNSPLMVCSRRSTFPVPMGVTIECVPKQEKTDLGEGYAYTILPQSVISSPHTLYK
jgi:hypothetical protein